MTTLPRPLAFSLILLASTVGYFALQVLAAFVAFFLYGSGQEFDVKSGTVSAWFVALQVALVSCLFHRKVGLTTPTSLLLAVFTPLALFLYFEYMESSRY